MIIYCWQEDMRQMPRVAIFLKNLVNYHTIHPSEKDVENSKIAGNVSTLLEKGWGCFDYEYTLFIQLF